MLVSIVSLFHQNFTADEVGNGDDLPDCTLTVRTNRRKFRVHWHEVLSLKNYWHRLCRSGRVNKRIGDRLRFQTMRELDERMDYCYDYDDMFADFALNLSCLDGRKAFRVLKLMAKSGKVEFRQPMSIGTLNLCVMRLRDERLD